MTKKVYSISEIDNLDDLPDDAIVVLDDRPRKYDEKKNRFVYPDEKGYDELPELQY